MKLFDIQANRYRQYHDDSVGLLVYDGWKDIAIAASDWKDKGKPDQEPEAERRTAILVTKHTSTLGIYPFFLTDVWIPPFNEPEQIDHRSMWVNAEYNKPVHWLDTTIGHFISRNAAHALDLHMRMKSRMPFEPERITTALKYRYLQDTMPRCRSAALAKMWRYIKDPPHMPTRIELEHLTRDEINQQIDQTATNMFDNLRKQASNSNCVYDPATQLEICWYDEEIKGN